MSHQTERGSVYLENARVLGQQAFAGDQHILRVHAPRAAGRATPGSFAHIACDPESKLRRPLSIMRADPDGGWLEFLYKPRGLGLRTLAARRPGDTLSVLAPIGHGFQIHVERPRLLALGGGVGIPPMIFLADVARANPALSPVVLMGSEVPFPFELSVSRLPVAGVDTSATHAVALLEEWRVASRLASNQGYEGAYRGFITGLADGYLASLGDEARRETEIFACGPTPMLKAVAKLARSYDIPCQVALEEFMACGIGGCAGCNVLVTTSEGPAMKRVCVDGPVFDAGAVYPA